MGIEIITISKINLSPKMEINSSKDMEIMETLLPIIKGIIYNN